MRLVFDMYILLLRNRSFTRPMPLQTISVRVLLLSCDTRTVEALRHSMEQASMLVEVCFDEAAALVKLSQSECEAVVIDFKDKKTSHDFLAKIRGMSSHRRVIAFAVLDSDNDVEEAFRAGANFIFERPLFPRIVARTLKAAYPLMLQERRSHFRYPLRTAIHVAGESIPQFQATTVNISERGIALETEVPLKIGSKLELQFTLPGASYFTKMRGEVCWNDNCQRVGVQYIQVPPAIMEQLQEWLSVYLQHSYPAGRRKIGFALTK